MVYVTKHVKTLQPPRLVKMFQTYQKLHTTEYKKRFTKNELFYRVSLVMFEKKVVHANRTNDKNKF